jgi:hypothetical protein
MLLSHSDTSQRTVYLDVLFRNPHSLLDGLKSQGATNFTVVKIHLDFSRDVCDHMNRGKEYETVCCRFLTLTRRCETLGTIQSRLVLVLVTDDDEYFKDHPQYTGDAYTSPNVSVRFQRFVFSTSLFAAYK